MERLTIRNSDGSVSQPTKTTFEAAMYKLAAYEDTDLEPKEIERIIDAYGRGMTLRSEVSARLATIKDISTDRLLELAVAEQDGRLVVLPCKVGDTIYRISTYCGLPFLTNCTRTFCKDCHHLETIICENNITCIEEAVFAAKVWGKTEFATRQEAKEALERRKGEGA